MTKTVCFGEIMLRLSPPGFERLVPVAGAAGDASAAAKPTSPSASPSSGTRATTSRALPANPIGDAALKALRGRGRAASPTCCVAASALGIYFAETGASQRASTVVYDRAHSAISEIAPGSVPWDARVRRRHVVPLDRHHPGARRRRPRRARARPSTRPGAPARTVSVDLNFRAQAVDAGRGAARDASARAAASTSSSPTKKTCRRCSASRCRTPT